MSNLKRISLDPSPVDVKKSKKFLNFIEPIENTSTKTKIYEAVLTLQESVSIEFAYFGNFDDSGAFHGQAVLDVLNGETCFKGNCRTNQIDRIFGTFEHGLLQGLVVTVEFVGDRTTYFIVKDGIVHSLVLTFGLKPIYPTVDNPLNYKAGTHMKLAGNGVGYLAQFRNGKPVDSVWIGLVGEPILAQGFLYGKLDKKGKLSGSDIAYIYPDYKTAMVGKFEDRIMKSAKLTRVTKVTCNQGMLQVQFDDPDPKSQTFFYDPSTNASLGSMWFVKEPLEETTVEVKESNIPGAGMGIFAERDIAASKVVAFYNGLILDPEQSQIRLRNCANKFGTAQKLCSKYRVSMLGMFYFLSVLFNVWTFCNF